MLLRENLPFMAEFFNPQCSSVDLKDKTDLDSLSNVDVYYEKWVKQCAQSAKQYDESTLWQKRFLQPENFNIEI